MSIITLHLDINPTTRDHDLEVDFDTDTQKVVKARAYCPTLRIFCDCSEYFIRMLQGPGHGCTSVGYWEHEVSEAYEAYKADQALRRQDAWIDDHKAGLQ